MSSNSRPLYKNKYKALTMIGAYANRTISSFYSQMELVGMLGFYRWRLDDASHFSPNAILANPHYDKMKHFSVNQFMNVINWLIKNKILIQIPIYSKKNPSHIKRIEYHINLKNPKIEEIKKLPIYIANQKWSVYAKHMYALGMKHSQTIIIPQNNEVGEFIASVKYVVENEKISPSLREQSISKTTGVMPKEIINMNITTAKQMEAVVIGKEVHKLIIEIEKRFETKSYKYSNRTFEIEVAGKYEDEVIAIAVTKYQSEGKWNVTYKKINDSMTSATHYTFTFKF